MLSDPQSITVSTVAQSLPRISVGPNSATYQHADRTYKLSISHSYGKRNRRVVRIDSRKTAADPLLDGVSREYSMSTYLVIDTPDIGFSKTETTDVVAALVDYLIPATTERVVGGES